MFKKKKKCNRRLATDYPFAEKDYDIKGNDYNGLILHI